MTKTPLLLLTLALLTGCGAGGYTSKRADGATAYAPGSTKVVSSTITGTVTSVQFATTATGTPVTNITLSAPKGVQTFTFCGKVTAYEVGKIYTFSFSLGSECYVLSI